jgi:hypothetical protein
MKTLSLARVVLCMMPACSDNGLHSLRKDAHGRASGIEVTPARIDFGAVTVAQQTAVQRFTIRSVGDSDLLVENIAIGGKDAGRFTILDGSSSFMLAAGASKEIDVAFSPDGLLDAVGEVVVTSNDASSPEIPVDLRGALAIAQIAIEPDPVDFGVVDVGCQASRPVEIVSIGDEPVTVESIAANGDGYTVMHGHALPRTLAPGDRLAVELTFEPTDARDFAGLLEVVSDDYYGNQIGRQFGLGEFAVEAQQVWNLEGKTDIVFFVDQSGSMSGDASHLAANFGTFISDLNATASDWQIIVVVDNTSCNHEGILSPSVPDAETRFGDAVTTTLWGGPESGLAIMADAVALTDPTECNAGFLRPDALLHGVIVSDEPDSSPDPWSDYVDAMVAKKGDAALVRISAIAGQMPTSCDAWEALGYAEAVAATGGAFIDICSDWATSLAALAAEIATQDTFPLDQRAVPASITVTVNGQRIEAGWTYDSATHAVVFEEASAPSEGDEVIIDYAGYSSCD